MIKKLNINRVASLLLCAVLLCGCAVDGGGADDIADAPVLMQETNELVLYLPYYAQRWMEPAVRRFELTYRDVNVTVEYLGDASDPMEPYLNRIESELMAGTGPDVLFADLLHMNDVYKSMNNGVFLNLTDVVADDEYFDMSAFNQVVMDAGIYKGRRYLIPMSYYLTTVTGIDRVLDAAGFNRDSADLISFLNSLVAAQELFKEKSGFQSALDHPVFFTSLTNDINTPLVDYETSSLKLNREGLRGFMEAVKPITDIPESGIIYASSLGPYRMLMAEEILLHPVSSGVSIVLGDISALETNEQVYLAAVPTVDGGVQATVDWVFGIRANSENQLNAYRFIKILLSDEVQWQKNSLIGGYPVRTESLEAQLAYERERFGPHTPSIDGRIHSTVSDEVMKTFEAIIKNPTGAYLESSALHSIFFDSMLPYLQDEKTFDECYDSLEQRLRLYISE